MTLEEELKQCKEKLSRYEKDKESNRQKMAYLEKENENLKNEIWRLENIELRNIGEENKILNERVKNLEQKYKQSLISLKNQYEAEISKAKRSRNDEEILSCLSRNNGNKTKTAQELGISRQALYQNLKKAMI